MKYTLLAQTAENGHRHIAGTSLVSHIEATYDDLRQIIGNDCRGPVGGKARASWWLLFEDGTVATIYDYQDTEPLVSLMNWSVGGHDRHALDLVREVLRNG